MPMLDIQKRHAEVFRIRFGDRSNGNPRKLTDAIRVTAAGESVVQAFVERYGGEVRPFNEAASRDRFQAYLPTTELYVMVLPGQSMSQWWELYRGSVCERRCTGETETLSDKPCMCPSDPAVRMKAKGACRPTTRINVICPDVDVVGAGSFVTHGMIAAETLPQSIAIAEAALARGLTVPAVLRVIEHKGRTHYVVPQLEIVGVSLQQLATGEVPTGIQTGVRSSLAPSVQAAIGSGSDDTRRTEDQPSRPDGRGDSPRAAGSASPRGAQPPTPLSTPPEQPPLPHELDQGDPPAAVEFDHKAWRERARALPKKYADELARGMKDDNLPNLTRAARSPEQAERTASLITGLEGRAEDETKRLRQALAIRCKDALELDDDGRHALVRYATAGERSGLSECSLDELDRVRGAIVDVEGGRVVMRFDDGGVLFEAAEVVTGELVSDGGAS